MLIELPSNINWSAKTPAAVHLFNNQLVAKLLHLPRRRRQDIQTAVALVYTRVKSPNKEDYKKLARLMQYICSTRELTLNIETDEHPHWWVHSSYAVHTYAQP